MKHGRFIFMVGLFPALAVATLIWRDAVRRERYFDVSQSMLLDPDYVKTLIGKRVTVTGDAGLSLGQPGRNYALFERYPRVHSWSVPLLLVQLPATEPMPADGDFVCICGLLQSSSDGTLLLVMEGKGAPRQRLWLQLVGFIPASVMPISIIGMLLLAMRDSWNRFRARPRFGPGCCQFCGYDLRASPHRCPECGTVAIKASV